MTLNVFNSSAGLVRGLDPSDFEAKLGGKAVKIVSVEPDERPHRIAVLLDTSGAVLGQPDAEEWAAANTIAVHISSAALQNTSLALFLFSDKVNEQIDFSKGAQAAAKRLAEMSNMPSSIFTERPRRETLFCRPCNWWETLVFRTPST